MIKSFDGARVVITGGASGIGLALGARMAAAGAHIALCDLNEDALAPALERLRAAGPGEMSAHAVDVTDASALEAFIDAAADRMGGLDVGWNNAGVMATGTPLPDMSWRDYRRVMDVNLDAVFHGSQHMARRMADQGTPALIVNTGSENSLFHGIPNAAAYVASKAAVRALTRALSQDTPDHIDVKLLCPGYVNTPLGTSEQMQHGMDVEAFADIAFPLLTSDQFHLVTHGYNGVRVREEHDALQAEIAAGAASVEDTARYDVGLLMQAAQSGR